MSLMLGLYSAPPSAGGALLLDATGYLTAAQISTDEHGFEALTATISRQLIDAFRFYDQASLVYVGLFWGGAIVWEGRLEDPAVSAGGQGSGLNIQALGAWRALTDDRYTALWSTTQVGNFLYVVEHNSTVYSESGRWQGDTNNRLYITLVKGNTYTLNKAAGWMLLHPDDSADIQGFQLAVTITLPTQMTFRVVGFDVDAAGALTNGVVHASLVGTGAAQSRAYCALGFSRQVVGIDVLCNAGFTYAAETDAAYAKVTLVRATGDTSSAVNTTLSANRNAGAGVTATVGSTTGMYAGMQLVMNSGNNPSEVITVTSVTSSTQFVATFANNYTSGQTVRGLLITADQIVSDVVSQISALNSTLNSTQLSSSTALIQSPGLDLTDEVYEDAIPADILTHLAELGDNQTTPRQWEVGVWEGRALHFRPHGDVARSWYVDVTDLGIARALEDLSNSVYATYKDAKGRVLRTADNTDSASIARYGLTRRQSISADTTSSTQAGVQVSAHLADHKDPLPRATVAFEAIYDAYGARYPLWMVRSGDTVTIRNLPPSTSTSIDRIRTFRISHTLYNLTTRALKIELEVPPPTLEVMLARRAEGIKR